MKTTVVNTPTSKVRPIKKNGYSSSVLHAKRDQRRQEAEARNAEYAKLTTKQKLTQANTINPNSKEARKLEARYKLEQAAKTEAPAKKVVRSAAEENLESPGWKSSAKKKK